MELIPASANSKNSMWLIMKRNGDGISLPFEKNGKFLDHGYNELRFIAEWCLGKQP